MSAAPRLTLASASPARARLLELAGIAFEVVVSGVDETGVEHLTPEEAVTELARRKAEAVAGRGHDLVLGCDSMFLFEGTVYGKPLDAADAVERWRRMRGRSGTLFTGHCVVRGDQTATEADRTIVRFGHPTDDEIDAYVATGEPLRVAGAFTLDNVGSPFVESVVGNPGTVIGLSLPVLRRLLNAVGVPITGLWR